MIHHGIDGWLDPPMIEVFREQVGKAKDGAVFVELGTYLGKSAACIAELIRDSGKAIRFYTVDDYRDHPMVPPHTLSQTVENLGELLSWVTPIVAKTHLPIKGVGLVDFCYVDASHDYESVCLDLDYWGPRSIVLAGDDYVGGVKRAVDDRFTIREVGRGWVRA